MAEKQEMDEIPTKPTNGTVSWTIGAWASHSEALRAADDRLRIAEQRFQDERDRRYSEVSQAKEKALTVAEIAGAEALKLARENTALKEAVARQTQDYKDEKAAAISDYVMSQQGANRGSDRVVAFVFAGISALLAIVLILTNTLGR